MSLSVAYSDPNQVDMSPSMATILHDGTVKLDSLFEALDIHSDL